MSRRGWILFGAFVAIDALDFALTVRDHLSYHASPGGVTVMPLGQVLGWASSVTIFMVLVAVTVGAVRNRVARARAKYRPPQ